MRRTTALVATSLAAALTFTACGGGVGVFGQFDPARMQQIVATFGPILQRSGSISDIPDPESLYTNEFVDPNIRMG